MKSTTRHLLAAMAAVVASALVLPLGLSTSGAAVAGWLAAEPPATTLTAAFTPASPCPWDLASLSGQIGAARTVRCGYVTVPQRHGQPDSGTLRLAVLDVQVAQQPSGDAIVNVEGGPGDPARLSHLADFAATGRDVIVYDQRGIAAIWPTRICAAPSPACWPHWTRIR